MEALATVLSRTSVPAVRVRSLKVLPVLPLKMSVPVPVIVMSKLPLIPPLRLRKSLPLLTLMVALEESVILPAQELEPTEELSAPKLPCPVPASVSVSAPMATPKRSDSTAPVLTRVPPAVVPRAEEPSTSSKPSFTVVVPV